MNFFRRRNASNAGPSASAGAPASTPARATTSFEELRDAAAAYASKGDYDGAVETYTAPLSKSPNDVPCLLSRSLASMSLAKPALEAGRHDAESAINVQPGSWQAWNQSGNALLASELYGEAGQAFEQAARLAQPMGREQVRSRC